MVKRTNEPEKKTGAGRSRTLERQQERRKQKRRQQQLLIAASVGFVAIVVLAVTLLLNQPAESPLPEGIFERYANLAGDVTENNFPRLGDAGGVVRVVMYMSFGDIASRQFHEEVLPPLLDRVRAGEVSLTFAPLTTGVIPNATGAAHAALCAGEQGGFWQYQDALFHWQKLYERQAFPPNRLLAGIESLGLNPSLYNECFNSPRPELVTQTATQQARRLLPDQRPTLVVAVDGVAVEPNLDAINQRINERLIFLRDQQPTTIAPEATAEPAPEATAEPVPEITAEPISE